MIKVIFEEGSNEIPMNKLKPGEVARIQTGQYESEVVMRLDDGFLVLTSKVNHETFDIFDDSCTLKVVPLSPSEKVLIQIFNSPEDK